MIQAGSRADYPFLSCHSKAAGFVEASTQCRPAAGRSLELPCTWKFLWNALNMLLLTSSNCSLGVTKGHLQRIHFAIADIYQVASRDISGSSSSICYVVWNWWCLAMAFQHRLPWHQLASRPLSHRDLRHGPTATIPGSCNSQGSEDGRWKNLAYSEFDVSYFFNWLYNCL